METQRRKEVDMELMDRIMWVEEHAWPPEVRAEKAKFMIRQARFPQGFALAYEDKLVGVSTAMIIECDPQNPPTSWEEVTSNGWIDNHDEGGNALYLVSVGVAKEYQGKGYGTDLINQQIKTAKKLRLKCVVLGSRVPSAHQHQGEEIEEIVNYDPEVNFYKNRGFEIVKIVENYMKDDPESLNYGVVMAYKL
jgi:ribosomal protein S18 acetylase RimI-like enzyme